MVPAEASIIVLIPLVAAGIVAFLVGYVGLLFLRVRRARGKRAFAKALELEQRLAGLLHWPSFSKPRLAGLHLAVGSKTPEALDLYEATLDDFPDRKVAAGQMAALLRKEDLARAGPLCRAVFATLYDAGVRTPLVWEMMKEIALEDGDEERAVAILLEWLEELPEREVCLELRDFFLDRDDLSPRAEAVYRQSLGFEEDDAPTLDQLYRILSDRWDTSDESLFLYRKKLETDPELEWANAALAEILSRRGGGAELIPHLVRGGRFDKALQKILEHHGRHPDDPEALRWMCEIVMRQEKTDTHSLAICHRYVEKGGPDSAPLAYLFRTYSDTRERTPEALHVFEAYRRAFPEKREGIMALAKAYRDTGRIRDSVWLLEEGLEEHPGDLHLIRDLARTLRKEEMRSDRSLTRMAEYAAYEWDESVGAFLRDVALEGGPGRDIAVRIFHLCLDHDPDDVDVLRALARIYLDQKKAMDGIETFRKLMDLGQEQPWVVRGLADLYAASGDRSDSAEKIYTRAVNAGVAGDRVILTLARMALAAKRRDGFALEIVRRAAGLAACPPAVKVELAGIYFEMGLYSSVISLCREVLEADPHDMVAERWLGKALTRTGTDAQAVQALERVFEDKPDDPRVAEELCEAYVAAGETSSKALHVYERYLGQAEQSRVGEPSQLELGARKLAATAYFRAEQYGPAFGALRLLYEESPDHARSVVRAVAIDIGAPREKERLFSLALDFGDVGSAHQLIVDHVKAHPDRTDFVVKQLRGARREHVDALGQVMEILEKIHGAGFVTVRLLGELASCHVFSGDLDMATRRWRDLLHLTHDGEREGPTPPLSAPVKARKLASTDVSRLLGRVLKLAKKGAPHGGLFFVAGRLFLRKEDEGRAAAHLERARDLTPGDREAAHFLKHAYRRFLSRKATDRVREKLADVLMAEERWDDAILELQQVDASYAEHERVVVKLARCFLEKGHPTVAAQAIEGAVAGSEPTRENLEIHYTLGVAYQQAGQAEKAKHTYERIGFVDYGYRDVRQRLEDLGREAAVQPAPFLPEAPMSPEAGARMTIGDLDTREFDLSQLRHERFEILEVRGRGGMARVYKALDHEYDPPLLVALKILPEAFAGSEKAVRLFKREAAATIKLTHENVVRMYATGEDGGRRYIAMEYIEGPDFASLVDRNGPMEPGTVVSYLRQILAGLAYAHGQGVFHKDVKPSNIMVTELSPEGTVKLTDFGIARLISDQMSRTQTLSVRGTLPYMSPQQVAGEEATAGDDMYSLGTTLYELLSGDPPFIRGDIAYQQAHVEPRPLLEAAPETPADLAGVVMKCLDKDPARRYRSAKEVLADLR